MRLIAVVLIVGAFVGGYHLGQKHQDTAIFDHVRGIYERAAEVGRNLADGDSPDADAVQRQTNSAGCPYRMSNSDKNGRNDEGNRQKSVTVSIGGKTYVMETN